MKIVAGILMVLQAVTALALVALSVHGPSGMAVVAPVYLAAAVCLTWWSARRGGSVLSLVGPGVLTLAAAPGILLTLDYLEGRAYQRRIAGTRVTDVRDEAILSAAGRPIGVRVAYTVTVPVRGYFAIVPSLSTRDSRHERLTIHAQQRTIDGRRDPVMFEPGKAHAMVVELYPAILVIARGERCRSLTPAVRLSDSDSAAPAPLRLAISETTYGNPYHGGQERLTRGTYDLGELYRGVLAEELSPCRIGS
jgi:hypothetical protein